MADQSKGSPNDLTVFTASSTGLNDAAVKELKENYGLDMRVRSSSAIVNSVLKVADDVVAYDRTNPGYDRVYDKDPNTRSQFGGEFINPAERVSGEISNVAASAKNQAGK
jgi:hypothetical protein